MNGSTYCCTGNSNSTATNRNNWSFTDRQVVSGDICRKRITCCLGNSLDDRHALRYIDSNRSGTSGQCRCCWRVTISGIINGRTLSCCNGNCSIKIIGNSWSNNRQSIFKIELGVGIILRIYTDNTCCVGIARRSTCFAGFTFK